MNNFNLFESGINGDDPCPPEDYNPDEEILNGPPTTQNLPFSYKKEVKLQKINEISILEQKNTKNWKKSDKFLQIKGISKQNLDEKTGEIEAGNPIKNTNQKKIFMFGKYRGKTFDYVRTNDENYWNWCCENIKDFNKN